MDNKNILFSLILNFQEDLRSSWMTTKFKDIKIEEKFLQYDSTTKAKMQRSVFIFIPFIYIVEIIYGTFIIKPYLVYGLMNSFCLGVHLLIFFIFSKCQKQFTRKVLEYIICIVLIFNLIFLTFSYVNMKFEDFRVLRIIYMQILIKNIVYILLLDNNIFVCFFFFFCNLGFLIYCAIEISEHKTSIIDEITVETILTIVGFYIKDFYDRTLRIVFIQKMKFEKLFDYNNNLLNCMSGYHFSYYNSKLIYLNDNLKNLAQFKLNKIGFKQEKLTRKLTEKLSKGYKISQEENCCALNEDVALNNKSDVYNSAFPMNSNAETKEVNNRQITFKKKKTIRSDSIKSQKKGEEVEETEEEINLRLFQNTLQSIFKEVRKYDNSKSFSEKDPRTMETITSNKNFNNINEKEESSNSENKFNFINGNINVDIDSNNNNMNNDEIKIKQDSENKGNINFDNAISSKDIFINKAEIGVSKSKLNYSDGNIQRQFTKKIGNSNFVKFKESELISEVDLDSFENLQQCIDYLAGNPHLQNVEQFVFLGQYTYISKGKSEFDLIYEKQNSKNLNGNLNNNKYNQNFNDDYSNEKNDIEDCENDIKNNNDDTSKKNQGPAEEDKSVSIKALKHNKTNNSVFSDKRNFSMKENTKLNYRRSYLLKESLSVYSNYDSNPNNSAISHPNAFNVLSRNKLTKIFSNNEEDSYITECCKLKRNGEEAYKKGLNNRNLSATNVVPKINLLSKKANIKVDAESSNYKKSENKNINKKITKESAIKKKLVKTATENYFNSNYGNTNRNSNNNNDNNGNQGSEADQQTKINFFQIYFRKINNVVERRIHDNTLIKNSEKETIENSLKKKMLAKIAHEFKTPLNSIIGLITQIRQKYSKRQESNQQVSTINRSSSESDSVSANLNLIQYLSNYTIYLINDVIQFVSNEKISEIKILKSKIKLKRILSFCFEILKTLIALNESKMVNITPIFAYDECLENFDIFSDEVRLNQIFLNLISNSVKFTKSGFIKISANYSRLENEIVIGVEDTGIGIKPEDIDNIFSENENKKVELNYEQNKMGTGIGLRLSYNIAKRLNHKFDFNSVYEKGSIFELKLAANSFRQNLLSSNDAADREQKALGVLNNSHFYNRSSTSQNVMRQFADNCSTGSLKRSQSNRSYKKKSLFDNDKNFFSFNLINNEKNNINNSYNLNAKTHNDFDCISNSNNHDFLKRKKLTYEKETEQKIKFLQKQKENSFINLNNKEQDINRIYVSRNNNSKLSNNRLSINKSNNGGFKTNKEQNINNNSKNNNFTLNFENEKDKNIETLDNNDIIFFDKIDANEPNREEEDRAGYYLKDDNITNLIDSNELNFIFEYQNRRKRHSVMNLCCNSNTDIYNASNTNSNNWENLSNCSFGENSKRNLINNISNNVFTINKYIIEKPKICFRVQNIKVNAINFEIKSNIICNSNNEILNSNLNSNLINSKSIRTVGVDTKILKNTVLSNIDNKNNLNINSNLLNIIPQTSKDKSQKGSLISNSGNQVNNSLGINSLNLPQSRIDYSNRNSNSINKILIVDDNKFIRESLRNTVSAYFKECKKDNNIEIIEASDGIDLLKIIIEDQNFNMIKFIFTDENMEVVNGSEAVKFLKSLEKANKIRKKTYILVSSMDDYEAREKFLKCGFDFILSKPLPKSKLDGVFKNFI